MNSCVTIVTNLFIFSVFGITQAFLHAGSYTHVRTPQLFNTMCKEAYAGDSADRNACFRCFYRATKKQPGYPTLLSMTTCADEFIDDDYHSECTRILDEATDEVQFRNSPTVSYCAFLECIRRLNVDSLGAFRQGTTIVTAEAANVSRKSGQFLSKNRNGNRAICVVIVGSGATTISPDPDPDPGEGPIDPRRG